MRFLSRKKTVYMTVFFRLNVDENNPQGSLDDDPGE
jgi:hypothetical protein